MDNDFFNAAKVSRLHDVAKPAPPPSRAERPSPPPLGAGPGLRRNGDMPCLYIAIL
jgi:hypothetical protein